MPVLSLGCSAAGGGVFNYHDGIIDHNAQHEQKGESQQSRSAKSAE
jgi:hypothetical protein